MRATGTSSPSCRTTPRWWASGMWPCCPSAPIPCQRRRPRHHLQRPQLRHRRHQQAPGRRQGRAEVLRQRGRPAHPGRERRRHPRLRGPWRRPWVGVFDEYPIDVQSFIDMFDYGVQSVNNAARPEWKTPVSETRCSRSTPASWIIDTGLQTMQELVATRPAPSITTRMEACVMQQYSPSWPATAPSGASSWWPPPSSDLLVLNIWPFIQAIYMSFSKSQALRHLFEFCGHRTTTWRCSRAPNSGRATWNTVLLLHPHRAGGRLPGPASWPCCSTAKLRGRTAFRAIFFLPMVVAPAAVAMVWKWLFNTRIRHHQFGLLGAERPLAHRLPASCWSPAPSWSRSGAQHRLRRRAAPGRPAECLALRSTRPPAWTAPPRSPSSSPITLPMVSPTLFVVHHHASHGLPEGLRPDLHDGGRTSNPALPRAPRA